MSSIGRSVVVSALLPVSAVFSVLVPAASGVSQAAPSYASAKGIPTPHSAGPNSETAGAVFFYADANDSAIAKGAQARFTIERPAVGASDHHSLGEMAVESSDGRQIVEEGWTVDPGQFGDSLPHLFVFHWVNGNATCYDGCGWMPASHTVRAGMALVAGSAATLKIFYGNGRWAIYYGSTLVGYFPETVWRGTFTSSGLTQWFGEVAAGGSAPCSQMGDGRFASSVSAATISSMKLINGPAVFLGTYDPTPRYYTVATVTSDSIRFGGPGGC